MNKELGKTGIIIAIVISTIVLIGCLTFIVTNILSARKQILHEQTSKEKFESIAKKYLNDSKSQFESEDKDKTYMCYYIDTSEYTGSVEVKKDSIGNMKTYIWLSNGTYYASGSLENLDVGKNSKTAPTNCHRFG